MFSLRNEEWTKNKIYAKLTKYGMAVSIVGAFAVGLLIKELTIPPNLFADGIIVNFANYKDIFNTMTVFAVGIPPLEIWISAIPTAIALYVIALGDFIYADEYVSQANIARPDETLDYDSDRCHISCAIRNGIMGIFFPFPPCCGPLWGSGTVAAIERYKKGEKEMNSVYDGVIAFILFMAFGMLFMPLLNLFKPILPIATGINFAIQGYASMYIAMQMLHTKEQRSICGVMAVTLAAKGAAWGLAVGIVVYLIIGAKDSPAPSTVLANKSEDALLNEA
jgi:hypothetical protein